MFFQAILIGIFCYLGSLSVPWAFGLTGGWYTLSRPLVSGMIVGLILGDMQTGIMVGVALQAVYIALVTPGGSMPSDLNFVAYPATALGILAVQDGADITVAVSLATTIGILGTVVFNLMMVINSYWNHKADIAVEAGNAKGIILHSAITPQITNFILRFVPTVLAVTFGAAVVSTIINGTPQLLLDAMSVLGGVLPAVGVAILLKQSMSKDTLIIYFLAGFTCVVSLGLNMISVAIIGALLGLLQFNYSGNSSAVVEEEF